MEIKKIDLVLDGEVILDLGKPEPEPVQDSEAGDGTMEEWRKDDANYQSGREN